MNKVSIGRIVHYVLANGEHRPAMIVRVWPGGYGNDEVKDGVNLLVFLDCTNDMTTDTGPEERQRGTAWRTSVRFNAENLANTWHWPEGD